MVVEIATLRFASRGSRIVVSLVLGTNASSGFITHARQPFVQVRERSKYAMSMRRVPPGIYVNGADEEPALRIQRETIEDEARMDYGHRAACPNLAPTVSSTLRVQGRELSRIKESRVERQETSFERRDRCPKEMLRT
jgi:hypothetical protein